MPNTEHYFIFLSQTDSMILCNIATDVPPLESVLKINSQRLGAWKIEIDGIISFYSPGPKSYEMTVENERGELSYIIKCKGLSLVKPLIERSNQKDAFKRLVYDSLRPLDPQDTFDENSESDLNVDSNQEGAVHTRPKMFMYQNRINIDSCTFLPKHIEMFKQINIIGPQSVLNVHDYVQFDFSESRSKNRASLVHRPPHWSNTYCELFDPLQTLTRIETNELKVPLCDETIQLYSVKKTAGLVPAFPFGYDFASSHALPFEKLSLNPRI